MHGASRPVEQLEPKDSDLTVSCGVGMCVSVTLVGCDKSSNVSSEDSKMTTPEQSPVVEEPLCYPLPCGFPQLAFLLPVRRD